MGDENQIVVNAQNNRNVFLLESLRPKEDPPDIYILEDEFGNSRKNRDLRFHLSVAVFLVCVILCATAVHWITKENIKHVRIDINEFEDVKLKELISLSFNIENKLKKARIELDQINAEYLEEEEEIEAEHARLRESILATGYSKKERDSLLAELEERGKKEMDEIRRAHHEVVREKTAELESLRADADSQKKHISKVSDKAAVAQSGEKALHKIRMDNLHDHYEKNTREMKKTHREEKKQLIMKYNPVFEDKKLLSILREPAERHDAPKDITPGNEAYILTESAANPDELKAFRKNADGQMAILSRLKKIPFRNSMQRSVLHLESFHHANRNFSDKITEKLIQSSKKKDNRIQRYEYFMQELLALDAENGFVIDPRDENRITVFMDKALTIDEGDEGLIFRKDDEFIASVLFFEEAGIILARPDRIAEGKIIRAFDKILLNKVK